MALTVQEVKHVALLARLKLNDNEENLFATQLSSILDYVDKLNELSTEDVEPLAHILPIYNVFRDDEVKAENTREAILSNAPLLEDNQYKVPKII